MRTQCESSTGLNIERILIDPETAKKLLKGNVSNRPFSRPWALQLSNAMERGEWKENGDTISFDEK
jgi:hypothetical protein